MFRALAAIAMIAAALPGTAMACGNPSSPIRQGDAPRTDEAVERPLAAWPSVPPTGASRCGSWQALFLARADADRRRHQGANAARDTARR